MLQEGMVDKLKQHKKLLLMLKNSLKQLLGNKLMFFI